METQEIELDGKKINIVIKLNGEYPTDIDSDDNYSQDNIINNGEIHE